MATKNITDADVVSAVASRSRFSIPVVDSADEDDDMDMDHLLTILTSHNKFLADNSHFSHLDSIFVDALLLLGLCVTSWLISVVGCRRRARRRATASSSEAKTQSDSVYDFILLDVLWYAWP